MGPSYHKKPVISPIKNVHEVIMDYYSCAIITVDRKLVTFGLYSHGGDYLDEVYGIHGSRNPAGESSVMTSVLTNVKKVVSITTGFAALDYNGRVYVWGAPAFNNLDISLNSGVKDIKSLYYGFLAIFEDSVKPYSYNSNSYYSRNFNNIANDVSQNCVVYHTQYSLGFFRESDNKVFVCGHDQAGNLNHGTYFKGDSSDVVGSHQLNNVRKLYANSSGFAVIKLDGSVQSWGHDSTVIHSNIETTYGGNLDSHVKKLFTNGYTWCALKEDETIVTWENDIDNLDSNHGSNFLYYESGINSTRFGGNGIGGARAGSYFTSNKLGFVKNVIPIDNAGFAALIDNNGEEKLRVWGWDEIKTKTTTIEELDKFNNSSDTCNLNVINSYNNIISYFGYENNLINNIDEDPLLPYNKTINVKVQSFNDGNKFVLNNDPSNNPLTDKNVNYEFDLSDETLSSHPFVITSTPYSNNSIWKKSETEGNPHCSYQVLLSNKYNIIKCQSHGVNMGSLYNDPDIVVDISEGEVVQTLFNENTKTTIGNYTLLNYDHSISDASMNVVTFTNYEERSAVFNLIKKVLAYKLTSISASKVGLNLTNSNFNFSDPILFNNNAYIFDSGTLINFESLKKYNNFYFGNLIKKDDSITVQINVNTIFTIKK